MMKKNRKPFLYLVSAVLALGSLSPAFASSEDSSSRHNQDLYVYNFACSFLDPSVTPNISCTAQAQVYAYDDPYDTSLNLSVVRGASNQMQVDCTPSSQVFYSGDAVLNPDHSTVDIYSPNGLPKLMVKRTGATGSVYISYLKTRQDFLPGSCTVTSHLVH